MKTYDKAKWHIDGGENANDVITRFKTVFLFLKEKEMINDNGLETLEYGMDSSVSINSAMVNKKGQAFLDKYYDELLKENPRQISNLLSASYKDFVK